MFKNRAIQLRFVKPEKTDPSINEGFETRVYDPAYIAGEVVNVVTQSTFVIGGAFAAYKIIETGCRIAVIAAKAITK